MARPPLALLLWLPALALPALPTAGASAPPDNEAARFVRCSTAPRIDCVVDGDTFWYRGAKIRIADINAPETGHPACAIEARLGASATAALLALLNAGPFSLARWTDGRERDRYGRLLRVVSRHGASLGDTLQRAGLAEPWRGRRGDWCADPGDA
jgi:endonuclease YncB( thermonuclease family)